MSAERPRPRQELGLALEDLRLRARKRPIDVVEAGLLPVDELLLYETGRVRAQAGVVHDLCVFYGAGLRTTDHLVAITAWIATFEPLLDRAVNPRTSSGVWPGN